MNFSKLPRHVAIIVDGNRRWAKRRGLPAIAGHKHVADKVLEPIIFRSLQLGIPYLTLWAFSTENWKRGERFAKALFGLLRQGLKRDIAKYDRAGICLNTVGDLSPLPPDLVEVIEDWKSRSKKNHKITVTIALNYGGRDEIVRAVNRLLSAQVRPVRQNQITEQVFAKFLDTAEPQLPDVDFVIRTGGEQRTSGFLPWQTEYAEWYFPETLMPDFTVREFDKALQEYERRERRFGGG